MGNPKAERHFSNRRPPVPDMALPLRLPRPSCDERALLVECRRSARALVELEPEWKALVDESDAPNPFLSWEWAFAWWGCFGAGAEPRILCVRDAASGRLVGLAPFVLRARPGRGAPLIRELSWLGGGPSGADHLDVLALPQQAGPVLEALVAALAEIPRDFLRLEGFGSDAALVRRAVDGARSCWSQERDCPYASLPGSWSQYVERLPARFRQKLRKLERRLERDSGQPVVYETIRERTGLDPALDILLALHRKARAEGHRARSRFAEGTAPVFHRRVAHAFAERGWLRLHLLRVGERVVAACYCFRSGSRVYFFQAGYEPAFARFGPGITILAHAIREAIGEGAREFDFLRGDEPYKLQFTRDVRSDLRAWVPSTARGRVAIAAYRVGRGLRNRLASLRQARLDPPRPSWLVDGPGADVAE